MNFAHFIDGLKDRLEQPLPGQEAQRVMAPYGTDNARFDPVARESARKGAVLILFYPGLNRIHFPLIKRSEYDGVHSGQIALPGGKKEQEDKDLFTTALREANEEIGIDTEEVSVIGSLTELFIPVSNFRVLPVIGYSEAVPSFTPDNEEVNEVIVADTSLFHGQGQPLVKEITVGDNFRINAPYYEVDERTIWGATAMMLGELKEVVRSIDY